MATFKRWADIRGETSAPTGAKTYLVTYEPDGATWLARIVGLDGCHTQGATLDEARTRIREALALFDDRAAEAELVDDLPLKTFSREP